MEKNIYLYIAVMAGVSSNFMVKSIADENGIRMPSFFGYLIWSFGILVPVFIVDTLVFFL